MFAFIRDLFKSKEELKEARKRILELDSTLQTLKLEMQEQDRLLKQVRNDVDLADRKSESTVKVMYEQQMEALAKDLASPMVQLKTQQHLSAQRQIQAKDVLTIAMRLLQSVESLGVKLEGQIGDEVAFDSTIHEGLSIYDESPRDGVPVKISMPGVSYNTRVIRKISVIPIGNETTQENS